ncbi:RraA family protein [Mycolicibacterium sp.]|uniref:RraA family protein n=1 Tax=Mycolicibacterium sp. TaxID=2320850 RepID=UPI003D14F18D
MTAAGHDELLDRLAGIDASTASDALDRLGIDGWAHGLTRQTTGTILGRAVTVQLGPIQPPDGSRPPTHLGSSAIDMADPHTVIVVAGGRDDAGGWGGLLTRAAVRNGVRGVVVDGVVRDTDEASALGFPVFARARTPRTARGRHQELSTNNPVRIRGLQVCPGDIVIADGDGVVVIPADRADEVARVAAEISAAEQHMAARIDLGDALGAVLDARYEYMLGDPTENRTAE